MQLPSPILRQRFRVADIPSGMKYRVYHTQKRDIRLRGLACALEARVEVKRPDDGSKGGVDVD